MRELSLQFAKVCGLSIPRTGPAGEVKDSSGNTVWHWYKCSQHGTWMQPCYCNSIPHWHCKAKDCSNVKPAKMRTATERMLFKLLRSIESNG